MRLLDELERVALVESARPNIDTFFLTPYPVSRQFPIGAKDTLKSVQFPILGNLCGLFLDFHFFVLGVCPGLAQAWSADANKLQENRTTEPLSFL